jgi:hypothetical protein
MRFPLLLRPCPKEFPAGGIFVKKGALCLICLVLLFFSLQGCKSGAGAMKEEKIPDSTIAAEICSSLAEAGLPPVRVFVIEGRVVLSGVVPSPEAKEKAIAIARNTPGVTLVSNDLELQKIR